MGLSTYDSLDHAVEGCFGKDVQVVGRSYVGGGDINDSFCIELDNGQKVFVKSNTLENAGFFDAEAAGIGAIASTGAIRTPKLLCKGIDKKAGRSFLMMEMIERTGQSTDCWEVFGVQLAAMHNADTSPFTSEGKYGFVSDNYIGATKQINSCRDTWISFFRECRLEPQFKMASGYFDRDFTARSIKFLDRLDNIMTEPDHPSLLHGDLWTCNTITGPDGYQMLIDPAVYVGHAEADIAMTELFGRLPEAFYRSYREHGALQEGYEQRRDIYNLYHLLNHLNLFGRSYLGAVESIVNRH